MKTRESKKNEYWNHFLEQKNFHFFGFTKIRLERAKKIIWHDKDFWWDVLDRHPGMKMTPDEMKTNELDQYGHCIGNMAGMIMQVLIDEKIIK